MILIEKMNFIYVMIVIMVVVAQIVYIVNKIVHMLISGHRGRKIRKKRLAANMTIEELASFAGIPKHVVMLAENGDEISFAGYRLLLGTIKNYKPY